MLEGWRHVHEVHVQGTVEVCLACRDAQHVGHELACARAQFNEVKCLGAAKLLPRQNAPKRQVLPKQRANLGRGHKITFATKHFPLHVVAVQGVA